MTYLRRTVASDVRFEGRGLHSGEPVTVVVHPGSKGIRFVAQGQTVDAKPENVVDTSRCTRLKNVATIEHLMSALAGLEVTDADVEVSGAEMPALDGAAAVYVEQLLAAGFETIGEADKPKPFSRVFVHDSTGKVAVSAGAGHWRYDFETGDRWPGSMHFETLDVTQSYAHEIAPARTFGFEEEVPMIQAAGLAKGLDESNVFLLGQHGFLGSVRFADEPPRHKLLDLIGDLYLSGVPIRLLNAVGEKSGHKLHVEAAHLLALATA